MSEWIGIGLVVRHGINPYFLLVQISPQVIEALSNLTRFADGVDPPVALENVSVSATSAYSDDSDVSAFIIPTVEWKLVGKDAAKKMWGDEPVIIRVSSDHAEYMKMSSIDPNGTIHFEICEDYVDLWMSVAEGDENADTLHAYDAIPHEWVEAWAANGIAGSHGQTVYEAIGNPQAPAVTTRQDEASATNPPSPPPPPVAEDEEEEEEDEEERVECESCGRLVYEHELTDGVCDRCGSVCEICNTFTHHDDMYANNTVCADCAVCCEICDEWFHPNATTDCVCNECRARHFRNCELCGDSTHVDDMSSDGRVCSDCGRCCDSCDDLYHPTALVEDLCPDCRANHYTQCIICHNFISNDDIYEDGVCDDCAVECEWCGDAYSPHSMVPGERICQSCAENTALCNICGMRRGNDTMIDGTCEDCVVECAFCREHHSPTTMGGEGICGECMITTALCANCRERFTMSELNAGMHCSKCAKLIAEEDADVPAPPPVTAEPRKTRRRRR